MIEPIIEKTKKSGRFGLGIYGAAFFSGVFGTMGNLGRTFIHGVIVGSASITSLGVSLQSLRWALWAPWGRRCNPADQSSTASNAFAQKNHTGRSGSISGFRALGFVGGGLGLTVAYRIEVAFPGALFREYVHIGGCLKIRGIFLRIPIIRTIIFWGTFGYLNFGHHRMSSFRILLAVWQNVMMTLQADPQPTLNPKPKTLNLKP